MKPADPIKILERVLDFAVRNYAELADFIAGYGYDTIKQVLSNALCPELQQMALTRVGYWEKSILLGIEGYHKQSGAGIYLDVIAKIESAMQPEFLRLYVGQAVKFSDRIDEHQRKMHLRKSLHHWVAGAEDSSNRFAILLRLDKTDDIEIWLNIAEQWLAVWFQCLPAETLALFLDPAEMRSSEIGLNIAMPLNQNHGQAAKEESSKLKNSTDPEVQAY